MEIVGGREKERGGWSRGGRQGRKERERGRGRDRRREEGRIGGWR